MRGAIVPEFVLSAPCRLGVNSEPMPDVPVGTTMIFHFSDATLVYEKQSGGLWTLVQELDCDAGHQDPETTAQAQAHARQPAAAQGQGEVMHA
jgi:hypothetical protein